MRSPRRHRLPRAWRGADEHADRSAAGDERSASGIAVTLSLRRADSPSICCATGAAGARRGDSPLPRFRRRRGRGQEALIAAAVQWPREGVPENPRGWLIQVASRRMTDHVRSEIARRRSGNRAWRCESELVALRGSISKPTRTRTTRSILFFMCCHPALTPSSAIALTLRAVGGLTTAEIANAFLVPEATMAQRISRAKQSIKASGVPFRLPSQRRAGRSGCAPCCTCST